MKIGSKKLSRTTIGLLVVITVLGVTLGAVLYQLDIPMQWGVSVAHGLELQDEFGTPISSIDWGYLTRNENKTIDLTLQSLSNKEQNVTCELPAETLQYQFGTDFVNCTLSKEGDVGDSVAFTVWLKDLDMTANGQYSGQISFIVVDEFPPEASENVEFEATEVTYEHETATYLEYVSDAFDKTVYSIGETIDWNFTTKIIWSEGVNGWSYNLNLTKEGSTIQVLRDQFTISGFMAFGYEHTEYVSFTVAEAGLYKLRLEYWLADPVVPLNNPPIVSDPNPTNGETNVPPEITELTFTIEDDDNLFDYYVTTSPDIGSTSDTNVVNGTYTCPVSGLVGDTTYTWYVDVFDGTQWTNTTYTFTTHTDTYAPFEILNAGADLNEAIAGDTKQVSQTFTVSTTHRIKQFTLRVSKQAPTTTGTLKISIRTVSGGEPTSTELCSGTYDISSFIVDEFGGWIDVHLGVGAILDSGVEYAVVISVEGLSNGEVYIRYDKDNGYGNGTMVISTDGGSTWTIQSTDDLMFVDAGVAV